eukprot:2586971-Amphidinium_carterae.1
MEPFGLLMKGVVISSLSHDVGWMGGAVGVCTIAIAVAALFEEGSLRRCELCALEIDPRITS